MSRMSLRSRALRAGLRLLVRRRSWRDDRALVRRARRWFGLPGPLARIAAGGVALRSATLSGVPTEWLTPRAVAPGRRGGSAPVLLYLHGGGYVAGSAARYRSWTAGLARRTGLHVLVPDYRLAPEHPFPAAPEDALALYGALLDRWGGPPRAVAGDSAGGGLALGLLVGLGELGLPLPLRPTHPLASPLRADLHGLPSSTWRGGGGAPPGRRASHPAQGAGRRGAGGPPRIPGGIPRMADVRPRPAGGRPLPGPGRGLRRRSRALTYQ